MATTEIEKKMYHLLKIKLKYTEKYLAQFFTSKMFLSEIVFYSILLINFP